MCGGIKDSQVYKTAILAHGRPYEFYIKGRVYQIVFDGYARLESLDYWKKYIKEHVKIEASSYFERDTVHHDYDTMHEFKVPQGKYIHAIIVPNGLRIVTTKANADVARVHHRMPHLVGG